jgi:hypothetical protein
MLRALENDAVIGPFALKYARPIMQTVGQDMYLRLAPGHETSIQPYPAVTIIIGNKGHQGHSSNKTLADGVRITDLSSVSSSPIVGS